MKAIWRIGVSVLGIALFGFAVENIGSGQVRGELEAMSGAIIVIFALSLIRLYLQTRSWSLALRQGGIQSSGIELKFLRLASQGIGYLTVLGPAVRSRSHSYPRITPNLVTLAGRLVAAISALMHLTWAVGSYFTSRFTGNKPMTAAEVLQSAT